MRIQVYQDIYIERARYICVYTCRPIFAFEADCPGNNVKGRLKAHTCRLPLVVDRKVAPLGAQPGTTLHVEDPLRGGRSQVKTIHDQLISEDPSH